MKVELIDVSSCKKKLAFEIENEIVTEERNGLEREFARKAKIPGFRPGKAPRSVIKARFAKEIEEELKEKIISENFRKAVNERSIVPLHNPILEEYTQKEGEPLKFMVLFEIQPDIKLENYKGMTVTDRKISLEEEEVDRIINSLRESFAKYEVADKESASEGDYVIVRLEGTITGGKEEAKRETKKEKMKGEMKEENLPIVVGSEDNLPEFNRNLVGMRKGEEREFDVEYPENYYAKNLAAKKVHYRMTLKEIKVKVLPELNDDFARNAYATYYAHDHRIEGEHLEKVGREKEGEEKEGKEKVEEGREPKEKRVERLEEFRALIRERMLRRKSDEREITLKNEMLNTLIDANDFEIPEVMVEDQLNIRMEGIVREMFARGINPAKADVNWKEIREKHMEPAKRDVKGKLILSTIAAQEKIEVQEAEIDERIRIDAAAHGTTFEEMRNRLSTEDLQHIQEQILREKALDFLFSNANIT
ncbi:MAG: trigger factor [Acidobacteriota bacterium]